MGFLDNSGDIILDAVLTDTGRMRLAKGDGSFKIVKFALADDEIDYEKYNADHASGSAYVDLDILTTPVFEAFTNNTSMMKSKLLSIPRTNLLYLPIMQLNLLDPETGIPAKPGTKQTAEGTHTVMVDEDTSTLLLDGSTSDTIGYLNGFNPAAGGLIRVDQGLDTTEISYKYTLDPDLVESNYIIEMDNRFGQIVSHDGNTLANPSFIDDDNIASYYLPWSANSKFVRNNSDVTDAGNNQQTIAGPRGTYLVFKIKPTIELASSTFLFTKLGPATAIAGGAATTHTTLPSSKTFYYIDSTIRITGGTTGYRLDIPVRYLKCANC